MLRARALADLAKSRTTRPGRREIPSGGCEPAGETLGEGFRRQEVPSCLTRPSARLDPLSLPEGELAHHGIMPLRRPDLSASSSQGRPAGSLHHRDGEGTGERPDDVRGRRESRALGG